jgi:hypothetical protein
MESTCSSPTSSCRDGYSEDAISHRGLIDGIAQVLEKPFTVEQHGLAVREALDAIPPVW